jgi:hypothetical protein
MDNKKNNSNKKKCITGDKHLFFALYMCVCLVYFTSISYYMTINYSYEFYAKKK